MFFSGVSLKPVRCMQLHDDAAHVFSGGPWRAVDFNRIPHGPVNGWAACGEQGVMLPTHEQTLQGLPIV